MGTDSDVKIGRVASFDPNNYFVFYLDSSVNGASGIPVVASPASDIFSMPEIGDFVKYQDGKCSAKRFLGTLNGNPDPWYGFRLDGTDLKDPNANPSNLLYMDSGDCFVGRHGRAYFNGDVFIHSDFYRSKLKLRDDGPAELRAYDFLIKTEDGGVEIYTEASTPAEGELPNFGDSLIFARNIPGGSRTNLRFDHSGSVSLSVLSGLSSVVFASNGDVSLHCGTDGADVPSPKAYIHLVNEVEGENEEDTVGSQINTFSSSLSMQVAKTAVLTFDSLSMSAVTSADLSCESLSMAVAKNALATMEGLTIEAKKALAASAETFNLSTTKEATLSLGKALSVTSGDKITVDGVSIALNSGEALAYKRALDILAAKVEEIRALLLGHVHMVPVYQYPLGTQAPSAPTTQPLAPAVLGQTGTLKTTAG